jgi:G3E family GTPase
MNAPVNTVSGTVRAPVHLHTGFLGSSKTTLLCNLLADPEFSDTAVIINEFGEAGLDHLLVREVTEDVLLLSSGCLCCTVREDLVTTLADLDRLQRAGQISRFSRVVVETTGLADPAPILQAILTDPLLTGSFGLGSVITTIDAINGVHTLAATISGYLPIAVAPLPSLKGRKRPWPPFGKQFDLLIADCGAVRNH